MDHINENSTKWSRSTLFDQLKSFLEEVIGGDFIDEYEINPESTFTTDLEMESIELVEFSEKLKNSFGEDIGFAAWMSNLELEQLVNLTINDVLDYLEQCL